MKNEHYKKPAIADFLYFLKMKKNLLILIIFVLISVFVWYEIYLPKDSRSKTNKIFSIEKGQSLFQIAENLEKEKLIKDRFSFDFYVILKDKQGNLQAGEYELNPSMNIPQIIKKFVLGDTFKIKLTFPEGLTQVQINELLQSSNLIKKDIFALKVGDFKEEFDFLSKIPDETSLEGFLFPDTYFFEPETGEKELVEIFLKNFDKKFNLDLKEKIKEEKKTTFEIITMASLIEKEVKTLEDKKLVSGILWKRLKNRIPLQVDATISYITGKKTTEVSIEETKIDSPYNTYKYLGLPKGSICNPGLESILAAIYPEDSGYWYYLSTNEGKTIFSKTLEEHNFVKSKYLK